MRRSGSTVAARWAAATKGVFVNVTAQIKQAGNPLDQPLKLGKLNLVFGPVLGTAVERQPATDQDVGQIMLLLPCQKRHLSCPHQHRLWHVQRCGIKAVVNKNQPCQRRVVGPKNVGWLGGTGHELVKQRPRHPRFSARCTSGTRVGSAP